VLDIKWGSDNKTSEIIKNVLRLIRLSLLVSYANEHLQRKGQYYTREKHEFTDLRTTLTEPMRLGHERIWLEDKKQKVPHEPCTQAALRKIFLAAIFPNF
jgi:hypothetical protein